MNELNWEKYETDRYARTEPVNVDATCIDCGECMPTPMIELLQDKTTPVFVTVAPAIIGQFGEITMGQLRTALKKMGFWDMLEVALFADILTIKEAFLFDHLVTSEDDFFITSCCCPVWFNLIRTKYPEIYRHLSPTVSPMIASGRILKALYPGAKVVFIGPCIAKKAEAKEPELEGAIDFVLNFRELQEIFGALKIHPEELPADEKDQASLGGRFYARTGGVSFSVKTVVNRLAPDRVIKLRAEKADGVKACIRVLDTLLHKDANPALKNGKGPRIGNFIEGMACPGGCVGGPRTIADPFSATKRVNEFGEDSFILTPFDNLNVLKILNAFGMSSFDQMMKNEAFLKLLTRDPGRSGHSPS